MKPISPTNVRGTANQESVLDCTCQCLGVWHIYAKEPNGILSNLNELIACALSESSQELFIVTTKSLRVSWYSYKYKDHRIQFVCLFSSHHRHRRRCQWGLDEAGGGWVNINRCRADHFCAPSSCQSPQGYGHWLCTRNFSGSVETTLTLREFTVSVCSNGVYSVCFRYDYHGRIRRLFESECPIDLSSDLLTESAHYPVRPWTEIPCGTIVFFHETENRNLTDTNDIEYAMKLGEYIKNGAQPFT